MQWFSHFSLMFVHRNLWWICEQLFFNVWWTVSFESCFDTFYRALTLALFCSRSSALPLPLSLFRSRLYNRALTLSLLRSNIANIWHQFCIVSLRFTLSMKKSIQSKILKQNCKIKLRIDGLLILLLILNYLNQGAIVSGHVLISWRHTS